MPHHGAVLHRSPAPMSVVGYFYPNGEHSKRQEIYRVPVAENHYNSVVKRIKQQGGSLIEKDEKLFMVFKPI